MELFPRSGGRVICAQLLQSPGYYSTLPCLFRDLSSYLGTLLDHILSRILNTAG